MNTPKHAECFSCVVQAKTMGNASIESVADVLRHLRHGIGWDICLKQRVSFVLRRCG